MYKRTYNFLTSTHQLYAGQYGFRKQHSCENAICELVSEVIKNQEQKRLTVGIFLDLPKAFDTLSHKILLQKFIKYGIRGKESDWYTSYLTGRQLRAKCNTEYDGSNQYSEYFPIEYGTPQGSCLGPLLFLIFTNDFYLCIENGSCLLFADDTSLYCSHNNIRYLKWSIEQDINRIMDWFKANKLTLNISKTECIYFNSKLSPSTYEINIGEIVIKSTNSAKIFWLDNKLSWKKHTNTLLMEIKQNSNLLQIGNKFLDKHCKKNIYYAHIYSHITYGLVLWGNMIDTITKTKIQKVMNKCFN